MEEWLLVTIEFEPSADGHQQPKREIQVKGTEIYGNSVRAVISDALLNTVTVFARPDAEVVVHFDKLVIRVKDM